MLNCTFKITWSNRIGYQSDNIDGIPASGGVYEIQGRKTTDGGYTRRYIGMSENLRQIYSKHLSDDESNEKLKKFLREKKAFFRYVTSDREQTRKDLQKGLYYKHKHSFNNGDVLPSGSGKYLEIKIEETNP
ncbi:MAG: hypothetical protein ACREAG_07525 [Nitrosopumilaceae archaeon]